jgi:hypothetical protein
MKSNNDKLDEIVGREAKLFFAHPLVEQANPHPKVWRLFHESITRACEEWERVNEDRRCKFYAETNADVIEQLRHRIRKLEEEHDRADEDEGDFASASAREIAAQIEARKKAERKLEQAKAEIEKLCRLYEDEFLKSAELERQQAAERKHLE